MRYYESFRSDSHSGEHTDKGCRKMLKLLHKQLKRVRRNKCRKNPLMEGTATYQICAVLEMMINFSLRSCDTD